jgi:hypothetical protein
MNAVRRTGVGAEDGMGLYVDGGRGTTGRLSPVKAIFVDASAIALIVVTAFGVLAVAFSVAVTVLR